MLDKWMWIATCTAAVMLGGCGGSDDGDRPIETNTERLSPNATRCSTSDECLYGYCSTEDGVCYSASCPPGAACAQVCYGTCIAAAPPR